MMTSDRILDNINDEPGPCIPSDVLYLSCILIYHLLNSDSLFLFLILTSVLSSNLAIFPKWSRSVDKSRKVQ